MGVEEGVHAFEQPPQALAASDMVLGRSSNGRTDWKDGQGRALKTLQESEPS